MKAVTVTLRTRCANCQAPLPVDGLWNVVPCGSCNHNNPVTPETWALVLQTVADEPEPDAPRSVTRPLAGVLWEIGWKARKKVPQERRTLPPSVFAEGVFDWPTVADEGEPAHAEVVEAIAHRCPSCSAPVNVDGGSRNVTCGGCDTSFLLPDAVWMRLHPPRDARPFVVVLPDESSGQAFQWFGLMDVARLPDGDLVLMAQGEDGAMVVRLDAELRPRWRRHGLGLEDGVISVAPDGRILVMDPQRHSLAVLSSEDGSTIGKLGGKEPEGATVHHLDVHEANDVCVCTDGSILVCVADRFARYDAEGKGMPTWPPSTGWFSWLFGSDKVQSLYAPGRLKRGPPGAGQTGDNRPQAPNPMMHTRFVPLPDGGVLMASIMTPLHAYRRDGTIAFTVDLPPGKMLPMFHRPALATDGAIWTAVSMETGGTEIWRRAKDGACTQLASTPHYVTSIVPTGEASAWLLGQSGEVWKLEGGALRARNKEAIDRQQWHEENGTQRDPDDEW